MAEEANIFVLSADSLPFKYFKDEISKISKKTNAVEFTNAISPGSNTSSSMPALAAGVYTDSLDMWGLPKDGKVTTLAESLSGSGYKSGLWTDNYLFGKEYNYDRGFSAGNQGTPTWKKKAANLVQNSPFDRFFNLFEWSYFNIFQNFQRIVSGTETFYKTAESLNKNAISWLESTDGSKFCWIHYMDTHHPYEPPKEYLWDEDYNKSWNHSELAQFTRNAIKSDGVNLTEEEIEDVVSAYRASCRYLRDQVNQFIQYIIENGHFDPEKDIFVFMADHGECLLPNKFNMMGHSPATFWEDVIHVPLAISRPDWQHRKIDQQVSLIDVLPTILDGAGVPIPDTVEGQGVSDPTNMTREIITSVSEWHGYDSGEVLTYRLARHRNGWKLFGSRRNNQNEVVLTKYDMGENLGEKVEYTTRYSQKPDAPEQANEWEALLKHIKLRGPPVEGSGISLESTNIDEEHLKNLGYLE